MTTSPPDLVIDLAIDTGASTVQAEVDLAAALEVADKLDVLEDHMARLEASINGAPPPEASATDLTAARRRADLLLGGRGLDESRRGLLDLIDTAAVTELRHQYTEFAPLRCRLDPIDVLVAGLAGLAGGAVDMFVVRIPKDLRWNDQIQRGSWLTATLRDLSIPSDNWLASISKVPFDVVAGYGDIIPGMGPRTHRVHTFGHDPLFGLLFGTIDIMRGTVTGAGKSGVVGVGATPIPGVDNPLLALALEILHLLSDVGTRCGLPLPGWSMAMTSSIEIGGRPMHELAREMYLRGYDSWHLLTMATTPAAIQLVLRAYWGLRMTLDADYRCLNEEDALLAGTSSTGDHPRFRALALAANGVGATMNVAKIAAFGGNPLAMNYAQWVAFIRSLLRYTDTELLKPGATTDALLRQYTLNRHRLDQLWQAAEQGDPS